MDLRDGRDFRKQPGPGSSEEEWQAYLEKPTLSPDEAMKLVPAALQLTRPGWNAFAAHRSLMDTATIAHEVERLKTKGWTTAKAREHIMEQYGIQDERSFRRRLAKLPKLERRAEPEGQV